MATHRIYFGQRLEPDSSGNVFWRPASIEDANDLYPGQQVLAYKDSGTKIGAAARVQVPKNYIGTAKIGVRWRTTATSGTFVLDVDYRAIANNESSDPTTHQESLSANEVADANARDLNDLEVSLTSANLAVDDSLYVLISRDGADAADTIADEVEIVDAWLEYADA